MCFFMFCFLLLCALVFLFFFFFNDPATTEIYTLSLHDALPIRSMPGVLQHTLDSLRKSAVEAADAGLAGVMIFGIPAHKDARGSAAVDPEGILNVALGAVREEVGDDCL